jgi:hypothetical protein
LTFLGNAMPVGKNLESSRFSRSPEDEANDKRLYGKRYRAEVKSTLTQALYPGLTLVLPRRMCVGTRRLGE